jgi:hypothetical protein
MRYRLAGVVEILAPGTPIVPVDPVTHVKTDVVATAVAFDPVTRTCRVDFPAFSAEEVAPIECYLVAVGMSQPMPLPEPHALVNDGYQKTVAEFASHAEASTVILTLPGSLAISGAGVIVVGYPD